MTDKPFIYVFNVDEATLSNEQRQQELRDSVAPSPSVVLCAKVEAELSELDDAEALELLRVLRTERIGPGPALTRWLLRRWACRHFSPPDPRKRAPGQSTRARPHPKPPVRSIRDFQKHFIKAEVVSYDDLISAGSMAAVKAAGKARIEGKEYVMRDGDVVEFRVGV